MKPSKSPSPKQRKFSPRAYTPIYLSLADETPDLHETPDQSEQGHNYRLQQISLLKKQLEDEREARASIYKKLPSSHQYHRWNRYCTFIC